MNTRFKPRYDRSVIVCAVALLLAGSNCLPGADNTADLDNLLLTNQWFRLRDAVLQQQTPLFYRGAVELAFHDWVRGEKDLQSVAKSVAQPEQAFDAGMLLEEAYSLAGRRKDARVQLQSLEKLMRSLTSQQTIDKASYRAFERLRSKLAITGEYPDQSVAERRFSRIPYVSIDNQLTIPLTINGKPANYVLDTGSSDSVLSESEAKRLGIAIHPASLVLDTYGGHDLQTTVGIAMATDVIMGNYHLRNADFLVQRDRDSGGYPGIIGLPILLALDSLRWNSDGTLEIGAAPESGSPPSQLKNLRDANLCLAGNQLVAETGFGGNKLSMYLDTGTYETLLFPAFGKEFASFVSTSGRKEGWRLSDTNIDADAVALDELKLEVGGAGRVASHVHVLSRYFEDGGWAYANLGMDFLRHARSVTLDFQAMRLTVEGGDERSGSAAACALPPDFGCQSGWTCTARFDPEVKCRVDRIPNNSPPGNPLSTVTESQNTRACALPANFVCQHDETCSAVFESDGKCRIDRAPASGKLVTSAETRPPESHPSAIKKPAAPALDSAALHGQSVLEIVRRSLKYESLGMAPTRDYVYTEDEETRQLDPDGNVKDTKSETKEAMTLYDQTYERVIKKNGQPLPPDKERAEQAKFEKATYKRSHESPEDKAKREAGERKEDARNLACTEEFLKAFTFSSPGAEAMNGRPAWIVEAEPALSFAPQCSELKLLGKFRFRLWIDQAEYRWSRFEGDNIAPVTMAKLVVRVAKGNLHMTFDQVRLSDGVWLPSQTKLRVGAKVFLLLNARLEVVTSYSNYRKFQADSRILPVGDPQ